MKSQLIVFLFSLIIIPSTACESPSSSMEISSEPPGSLTQAITGWPCRNNRNCDIFHACFCGPKNECVYEPGGFGPPDPPWFELYCGLPPSGTPSPDKYESDDDLSNAFRNASYRGVPQLGHTFHRQGDVDLVPVYFKEKGTYTFETYNLTGEGADTALEIFKVNYTGPTTSTLGMRAGYSDNVCAWLYRYDCLASSVTITVPDDSWYVARITNNDYNTDRSLNDYNIMNRPGYDFHIWK